MEVTFNRQTIISFPDNDNLPDITSGIADGSLVIDEILYPERFTIGEYNANRFEAEIYNYPMVGVEKIYVYQIVDEVEGAEPVEVPLFTGYVDSCTTNRGRDVDSKKIIAYDILYSKANVNVAEWWESIFENVTSITLKTFRESLLDYMGLDYESVDLPNDYIPIRQNQQLDVISFGAMFKYILEANGTNANVDKNGTIRFITVSDEEPVEIDETYAQNTSEFDTYIIPAFGGVRITNSSKNVTGFVGESNFVDIKDNLLLMDKGKSALDTIAQNIFAAIENISYKPAQIDMIWHQLDITVGMWIKIGSNLYLVCENYVSGSQLVEQQILSNGMETIEDASLTYDAARKDMQAQINASSLKYYRYQNLKALEFSGERQIISIRYTSAEDGVIIFHGCVVFDLERIDDTEPAIVTIRYSINNTPVREYTPTETYYHDGRYTFNLMHFWESMSGRMEKFIVYMIPENCKITIGAFKCEGYMAGMGLVGDAVWDGIIDLEDVIYPTTFATTPTPVPFDDSVDVGLHEVIVIEAEDNVDELDIETVASPVAFAELLQINKEPISDYTWDEISEYTWDQVEDMFYW